ncbi:MAG: AAA family ATPase [Deltaproteobacteria bacterium]
MNENVILIRLEINQSKVKEDLEEVISSMEEFELQQSGAPSPCDVLILEIGEDPKKEFQLIHKIQDSGVVREIFLTSLHLEPNLLLQALRAGAKEFFSQPIKKDEIKEALLKFRERREKTKFDGDKKKKGKIIDVIGSKGGVGNTTIAVNLATSLIESGRSPLVALIDMNLLFGEIPIFLNIESGFNWGEVARNITRLDSTYLMSILFKHSSGVYVLPSPTGLDGVNVATPEIIALLLGVMRNVFDYIVIDGGQAIDDISLKILEMSETVLLVGILSLPCLTNLKRLLWIFQKLGYPQQDIIKIIINRHQEKKSVISLTEAEESINQKIYWFVPNDYPTTMSAINQGKTLSSVAPGAEVSKNLRELAAHLIEKSQKEKGKGRFWSEIFK